MSRGAGPVEIWKFIMSDFVNFVHFVHFVHVAPIWRDFADFVHVADFADVANVAIVADVVEVADSVYFAGIQHTCRMISARSQDCLTGNGTVGPQTTLGLAGVLTAYSLPFPSPSTRKRSTSGVSKTDPQRPIYPRRV